MLTDKDLSYTNLNFWYFYISCFRGFDDENELNMDEVINECVDSGNLLPSFQSWYARFISDTAEFPILERQLSDKMIVTLEIAQSEINFYINNKYIGNLGGHFQAWFLTWEELTKFNKFDFMFLLLLPMSAIEKSRRVVAESVVSTKLKQIPIFAPQSDYIAQCIVNGLVLDGAFSELNRVGIINNENHSVRNIEKYPQYKNDVIVINRDLQSFVQQ